MIVKNEQDTIIQCLESCAMIFDEIVIVDTGSTDKTLEKISRRFFNEKAPKLIIEHFDWIDDFAAARNFAFSKCTGDWIFWLDADDIIKNPQLIRKQIDNASDGVIGLLLPYHYYCEGGKPIVVQTRERAIRREEFTSGRITWKYPIHEVLTVWDHNKCIVSYDDNLAITHNRSNEAMLKDRTRNITMLEKHIHEYGNDHRFLFHYANELLFSDQKQKAIEIYERVMLLDGFIEEKYQAYIRCADLYKSTNKEKSVEYLKKAMSLCPFFDDSYFELGNIYYEMNDIHSAISMFEIFRNGKFRTMLSANIREQKQIKALEKLEFCYSKIGNWEKVLDCAQKLLEIYPGLSGLVHDEKFSKEMITKHYSERMVPIEGKLCINMGSGAQKISGFYACDKFDKNADFAIDMAFIPLNSKSVDVVRSEHSLEHLTHKNAMKFLEEAHRVLKPGGYLDLEIPDFEKCSEGFLNAINNDDGERYNWYQMTIWGRQYTNEKIDPGQFHTCGFTKTLITGILNELGFYIKKSDNSNKYGTPSIEIIAYRKPCIYFIDDSPQESATGRIRRKNLYEAYLKKQDQLNINLIMVKSYNEINKDIADAIIFTMFDEQTRKNISESKALGIRIYYDHNEAILEFPGVKETLSLCDMIFCCSRKLKEITEQSTGVKNCVIIPDSYEE